MKSSEYICALRGACHHHNYKWPSDLWTGVMFFQGHKITVEEFMECVNLFGRNK